VIDHEPVQKIQKEAAFEIEYHDLAKENLAAEGTEVCPFDLSQTPLLRVRVIKLPGEGMTPLTDRDAAPHLLMVDMHHIISDGVSMATFVKEFAALYLGETLPLLKLQYKDISHWQNQMICSGNMAQQEAYWLKQFSHQVPVLDFPTDYPRPPVKSTKADTIYFRLGPSLTTKIKELVSKTETTLNILLMTVLNVLLFKYTGQEDIVVGMGIAGRTHTDQENIIGGFINLLVLRNQPLPGKIFMKFLGEVKKTALDAYENQDYQFEELMNKLDIPRDPGRHPLFEIEFTFQNVEIKEVEITGLKLKPYNFEHKQAKFDLSIHAFESVDTITISILYSTALFKRSTAQSIADHFIEILEKVVETPGIKLEDITISRESEDARSTFSKDDYMGFGF
jgi:hypothetical protein